MLDKKHKLLEIKTKALVDSLFVWNYKTKYKWKWIEFVDFKEYNFWDDIKNIDFIRSAQEWKTLVKLFEEERELSIYFLIDIKSNFFQEIFWVKKIDLIYEIIYLLWFSALKQWDKIWALVWNSENKKFFHSKKWKQNFINIINFIEWFKKQNTFLDFIKNKFSKNINSQNTLLKYFNSLKVKNSLVFYFSDNLDIDEKDLKTLSIKNELIFIPIFSSFENNLSKNWVLWINNWKDSLFIDLSNKEKKDKYLKLRNEKLLSIKKKIRKNSWKFLIIDETKNIYLEIFNLFKK